MSDAHATPSAQDLRRLCRTSKTAALATIAAGHKQVDDGWPVTSMVVPAIDVDGTPILLISDLADHTRHIAADNRVSLLFSSPSTGQQDTCEQDTIETDSARLTLFGRARRDDAPSLRTCYLRAHPDAVQYADFADFGFYRIIVDAIYWVGGFGKQRRLPGSQFIEAGCHPLMTAHDDIVAHMNQDHLDALADITGHYTDHDPNAGWLMHTIDCDGMVLTGNQGDYAAIRIDFPGTIHTPGEAREILVEMCKISRA